MKKLNYLLMTGALAAVLCLTASNASAQRQGGRGNFDPEQMRQRMMDNYKERLEVTSDDEWKVISERVEKVMNAQRDARSGIGGFGGFRGNRGGGGGGGNNNNTGDNGGRNRNPFGGEPSAEVDALQKALDAKASNEELKSKLSKLRASQKEKEAAVTKAQDELRKVLSVRQESTAVLMGLLK